MNRRGDEVRGGLQENEQLEPGKPVERELAGREIDSYRVILREGQFLHVTVSPQEAGMVMTLLGPDGKQVTEMSSQNSTQGLMLRAIATVAGDYRLQLRLRNEQSQPERYVIKIEELRVATPQDRKQCAADLAFAAARQMEEKGAAEGWKDALKEYTEASRLMRDLGDHKGEAVSLNRMGLIYKKLGDNYKALEYYNHALTIISGRGEDREEASILNNAALLYNTLGERQKALEYYNRALPLIRATGDWKAEAVVLNNMGALHFALAESQKALEHLDLSLQLMRAKGGQNAVALNGIGVVYDFLGEKQKALEYFHLALSYTPPASGQAASISANIGVIYDFLGEKQKALEYFNRALTQFRSAGDRRGTAITLHFIGSVYNSSGDSRKAIECYDEALSLIQATGDRYREALILTKTGEAYDMLGEKQKALDYYGKSLLIGQAVKSRHIEALARYRTALTLYSLNNLAEARTNIEAALDIIESLRTKIASSELRASYFASVQQYYDFYIGLLMRLDQLHPDQAYDAMALHASERARARVLLEMLMEGRVDIHEGVEPSLLERERSLKQSLDVKTEIQVKLLSREHNKEQAEQIDEEIRQLLAQYQKVKDQIKLKSPGYAALTQPRPLTVKEIQEEVLDPDTLLLEYALGEQQSYLWAVTRDSMITFRLPKRAEIEEAAQRVYELLSVDRRERPSQFNSSYSEASSALSQIILGPVAAHLGQKRLLIVPQGTLSYIPFAALPLPATQKHERLAHPGLEPLIAKHEIIYLPSASTLAVLRRELAGRKLALKAVAVIADPVFSKDDVRARAAFKGEAKAVAEKDKPIIPSPDISQTAFLRSIKEAGLVDGRELPRLPFSGQEARTIFALGRQAEAMIALDFNANLKTATSAEMGQHRIIHFATHALLNNEHPEMSGLVLSLVNEQGEPQNGFLRLYDIYNLRLAADLVVLSACQTALGKQIRGEGLVGVTRGFMYAGAARVMASLWRVDDQATAELMNRFYIGMMKDKQEPAAALRGAQLWMQKQKRWQSPYYWSGFIIQGEWR
ncbi:MAG: CHAT domain-containing tetratricopeptide repeat protein [Blastocatellia bacterium]